MVWKLRRTMFPEVAQTLQEARKNSRTLENVSGSLQPLTEGTELYDLERIESLATEISGLLTKLYNGVAQDAFGPNSEAPKGVVR